LTTFQNASKHQHRTIQQKFVGQSKTYHKIRSNKH